MWLGLAAGGILCYYASDWYLAMGALPPTLLYMAIVAGLAALGWPDRLSQVLRRGASGRADADEAAGRRALLVPAMLLTGLAALLMYWPG